MRILESGEPIASDNLVDRKTTRVWQAGSFILYHPVGCAHCNKDYKGRIGLHELMIGSDKIKVMLQERARVTPLLVTALEDGKLTLKMDGIGKFLSGATNIRRVRQARIK